jgi:para-nitrobenzyl esterase
MSVGTLMGAPSAQGLFHRAILQSGAAHNVSTEAEAARVADTFAGCVGQDLTLEKLQSLPVPEILRAQRETLLKLPLLAGKLAWQPALDADLLPELPLDAVRKGRAKSVDMLIGTNRDEWKLFMLGDKKAHRLDEAAFLRRLKRSFAHLEPEADLVERAAQAYRASHLGIDPHTPRERWVAFQSDRVFRYPAAAMADGHSASGGRTFAYLFTWSPPMLERRIGSCHALEIPFVFGTLRESAFRPLVSVALRRAHKLSLRMQDAWIAFARNGDPGHERLHEWPDYAPGNRSAMIFGADHGVDPSTFEQAHGFWSAVI